MKDILVSVIVPIFNTERFLRKCLDSILNQTYTNLDVILIDDGSEDCSGEICDEYELLDCRVRVFHRKNAGLSAARNIGIENSKGDYICFVDSDDYLNASYVGRMVEIALNYQAEIVQCDFLCVDISSIPLPNIPYTNLECLSGKEAIHKCCCTSENIKFTVCWNKLYFKRLFENIRFPIDRQHEDEFTSYKLLYKANLVANINEYLYYYLQRNDSIMGRGFSIKNLDVLDALKERMVFLKDKGLLEEYESTYKQLLAKYRQCYSLLDNISPQYIEAKKILKKEFEDISNEKITEKQERDIPVFKPEIFDEYFKEDWVLYGAGEYGRCVFSRYNYFGKKTLKLWIDNFWYVHNNLGFPVKPLDRIVGCQFEYLIIAVSNKTISHQIQNNLISWGISPEKIILTSKE